MEKENGRENNKKNVRSKYRTEYSGDHNFDYKDPASLTRFIGDAGKITPARISKLSIAQQKQVAAAVKKARTGEVTFGGAEIANGVALVCTQMHQGKVVCPFFIGAVG